MLVGACGVFTGGGGGGGGGGEPLSKRTFAGIWPAIGVISGPIAGHARVPHHDGLPDRYRDAGRVWLPSPP